MRSCILILATILLTACGQTNPSPSELAADEHASLVGEFASFTIASEKRGKWARVARGDERIDRPWTIESFPGANVQADQWWSGGYVSRDHAHQTLKSGGIRAIRGDYAGASLVTREPRGMANVNAVFRLLPLETLRRLAGKRYAITAKLVVALQRAGDAEQELGSSGLGYGYIRPWEAVMQVYCADREVDNNDQSLNALTLYGGRGRDYAQLSADENSIGHWDDLELVVNLDRLDLAACQSDLLVRHEAGARGYAFGALEVKFLEMLP